MSARTTFKVYTMVQMPARRNDLAEYKRVCLQTVNYLQQREAQELADKHREIDSSRVCFYITEEQL